MRKMMGGGGGGVRVRAVKEIEGELYRGITGMGEGER